ncbi:MAG: hypothetical protein L0J14_02050 [Bifidobacterium crudilactis]|jgi:CYTH domain-containing protein|nr:hypothetical protein [Bifidobacterium crudilactis]MDN6522095.1 hypothetical protein [Bifidobacterium crudilactis]
MHPPGDRHQRAHITAKPYNGGMRDDLSDFEYERRFFCHAFPADLDDGDAPILIVQSYYVHQDNFALRVRLQAHNVRLAMDDQTQAIATLQRHRDAFTDASVTVKGPAIGGTRYEAERDIDPDVAVELVLRGGSPIVKNRYSAWLGEDGWDIDVFGGSNAPLIVAEAERRGPVTDLVIPDFCVTEITDDVRFSNDGLAERPYALWKEQFEYELLTTGPHFLEGFGTNRREKH